MPHLRQRAEELKDALKQRLWNKQARWFEFQNDQAGKKLRLTVQMFKLFGSKVLDVEQEAGLLSHLTSEREFLATFGLESMSKSDIAYDPVDYDNGGGGCFTAFPAAIAERLYKAGHPAVSEDILRRILWWGDRTPYWGDSFAVNEIAYRRDTPLQCTIDSAAAALCIIFGMFGVRAEFNGDLHIDPHPPSFLPQLALKGLRLRGHVVDITIDGSDYEVRDGNNLIRVPVGGRYAFREASCSQVMQRPMFSEQSDSISTDAWSSGAFFRAYGVDQEFTRGFAVAIERGYFFFSTFS